MKHLLEFKDLICLNASFQLLNARAHLFYKHFSIYDLFLRFVVIRKNNLQINEKSKWY